MIVLLCQRCLVSENLKTNLLNRQTSSDPEELREFAPLADHGTKWVYLIGMWVIFGLGSVYSNGLLWIALASPWSSTPAMVCAATIAVSEALVLFFVTRRFFRLRAQSRLETEIHLGK